MVGRRVEILRRAAIALHHPQCGISRIDGRAAEFQKVLEQMLHQLAAGRFHSQAQVRGLAVGAADAELFHFEAAVMFHHLVEDVLHHVGIDQVAFRFHYFL